MVCKLEKGGGQMLQEGVYKIVIKVRSNAPAKLTRRGIYRRRKEEHRKKSLSFVACRARWGERTPQLNLLRVVKLF